MMGRVTRAAEHLSSAEVKARMEHATNMTQRSHWLIVYNALVDPRPAASIALHTGVSVPTVRAVISRYNRFGPSALMTPGKGGRRHQYLTIPEEQRFLAPFIQRAASGEIATAQEIQQALAAQLGHPVDLSSIYRLLARHGWRKLVPRPVHPQADAVAQAAFKKTLRRRLQRRMQRGRLVIRAHSW